MRISLDQSTADPAAQQRQPRELKRVKTKLETFVMEWCRLHLFAVASAQDLLRYVTMRSQSPIAPDSPGRILRQLRAAGQVSYDVVCRRASTYRITAVTEAA